MDYKSLSPAVCEKILADMPRLDPAPCGAIRRDMAHDEANLWRPAYIRDAEKILHCPYYNRYADKTQVFTFYKNDDITRRGLHVQLVSRIARNIGRLLGLNLDLIEAIALGHDIGHPPFGHAGEEILSRLYFAETGRYFQHNVQSVRVLDGIFHYNISLQTLDGILCHNGEYELMEYRPAPLGDFAAFDKTLSKCYVDKAASLALIPATLEGCVVRISDIIAYIGKDRQDAVRAKIIESDDIFADSEIGRFNAAIINNLIVNIVENSYGKGVIKMDKECYDAIRKSKMDNYSYIYKNKEVSQKLFGQIEPMYEKLYSALLSDLKNERRGSYIFRHHIAFVERENRYYAPGKSYLDTEPNQIVVDYIASMTDDYFVDLYSHLFGGGTKIEYIPYFK